ncbi:MAG: hypothetical protein IPK15_26540 [Verrucomicrobia bacterium]|nr:hypothetical protein [Verrucomicrobiota bacterium]
MNPAHGTLSGIAPNLTYAPDTNYHGTDFFKYRMTDNNGLESIELTVNITITPVNDLPALGSATGIVTVGEGGTATNTGFFFDQDDAVTLTASIGSLTRNDSAGTWVWSLDTTDGPESDTVTITANDRSGAATNFTFTLEITNLAPTALAQILTTPTNTPISLILRATDPGADTLTYTVTENPVHGTLSGAVPHLTYTPGTNYVGADSFQFAAIDSDGAISAPATVSISVIPSNTPVAAAGSIRQSGADFIVTFFGLPGSDYRVQFTSDLSSPAVWNEFAPPAIFTASPSGAFSHTNVTPPGPFRFYRAISHLDDPLPQTD